MYQPLECKSTGFRGQISNSIKTSLQSKPHYLTSVNNHELLGLLLDMAGVDDDGGNETVSECSGGAQRDIVKPMLEYSGNI